EIFQGGADAQRAPDLGGGHGLQDLRQLLAQAGVAQVAMGVGEHGGMIHEKRPAARGLARRWSAQRPDQSVWVWRSDPRLEPRISSSLSLSWRDLSSAGKRMPTPWVRPPCALVGVTQATLPATG